MSNLTIDAIFSHFLSHTHQILVKGIPAIKETNKIPKGKWTCCFQKVLFHLLSAFRNQRVWRMLMDTQQSCPLPISPTQGRLRGHAATWARSWWINHNRFQPKHFKPYFLNGCSSFFPSSATIPVSYSRTLPYITNTCLPSVVKEAVNNVWFSL